MSQNTESSEKKAYILFKEAAIKQGYTTRGLSILTGLSFSHIAKMLRGKRVITKKNAELLNNVFETDIQP